MTTDTTGQAADHAAPPAAACLHVDANTTPPRRGFALPPVTLKTKAGAVVAVALVGLDQFDGAFLHLEAEGQSIYTSMQADALERLHGQLGVLVERHRRATAWGGRK